MDAFVLTNAALDMCLEIPSADDGGEFDPVELHAHCHGGHSQAGVVFCIITGFSYSVCSKIAGMSQGPRSTVSMPPMERGGALGVI